MSRCAAKRMNRRMSRGIWAVALLTSVAMIYLLSYHVESPDGFIIHKLGPNGNSTTTGQLLPQGDWELWSRNGRGKIRSSNKNRAIISDGNLSSYSNAKSSIKQTRSWIYPKFIFGLERVIPTTSPTTTTTATSFTRNITIRNATTNNNKKGRIRRSKRFTKQTDELDGNDKETHKNRIRLRHSYAKSRLKVKHDETNKNNNNYSHGNSKGTFHHLRPSETTAPVESSHLLEESYQTPSNWGQFENKDNFLYYDKANRGDEAKRVNSVLEGVRPALKELVTDVVCYRTEDVLVVVAITCALNFTFVLVIWTFVRWFSGQRGKVKKKYYCRSCKKYLKSSHSLREDEDNFRLLSEEKISCSSSTSASEDEEESEPEDHFYKKVYKKFNSMEDLRYYYT